MSAYSRRTEAGKLRWHYRRVVRLPDGTKCRVAGTPNLNTKAAALDAESAHVERVLRPPPPAAAEIPTVRAFFGPFMDHARLNNKESGVAAKQAIFTYRLLPLVGDLRLDEVRHGVIEQLKARLISGERPGQKPVKSYSPKTVNNTLVALRSMLGYAKRLELIASIPRFDMLKRPPDEIDFLDFDELDRVVAAADTEGRALVLVGAEAGLRIGEVKALRWDDIDFERRVVAVNRRDWRGHLGSPKGGKTRRVPLTARLLAALKAHRHLMEWVFCQAAGDDAGSRYTDNEVTSRLQRACRRAGVRQITYHVLRHTFCSHLAMRGAPARAIQELAGHASITTTQRYMHLSPAAARDAIDLLDGRGTGMTRGAQTAVK